MSFISKIFGPKSKYDKSLPYTYTAKVYSIEENKDIFINYFSDTICGLIEHLDKKNIEPENVEICGVYRKKEIPLDIEYCISSSGRWLERPHICQSLENHYKKTLDIRYKGHTEKQPCAFDDRDRNGS
ncbi:MAG: hypothetical protein GXO79_02350 [Chlorobi bacterium]|nr:hypothetical protein [Chlorobiota bacterium]